MKRFAKWAIVIVGICIAIYYAKPYVESHLNVSWNSAPKVAEVTSTAVPALKIDPFWQEPISVPKKVLPSFEAVVHTGVLNNMEESVVYVFPGGMDFYLDSPTPRVDIRVFPSEKWESFTGSLGNRLKMENAMFQIRPVGGIGDITIFMKKKGR